MQQVYGADQWVMCTPIEPIAQGGAQIQGALIHLLKALHSPMNRLQLLIALKILYEYIEHLSWLETI